MWHRIEESHDLSVKGMQKASTFPPARWAWADSRLSLKSLPSLTSVIQKVVFTCNPEKGKLYEGSSEVMLSIPQPPSDFRDSRTLRKEHWPGARETRVPICTLWSPAHCVTSLGLLNLSGPKHPYL